MTNHKKNQKTNFYYLLLKAFYKFSIIFYSFYLAFSSQVFALQAEAPVENKHFREVRHIFLPKKEDEKKIDNRPDKIRAYFDRYNLPLEEQSELFVKYADKYGIDWALLPAIGMIESTGGKFACGPQSHNAFGWFSCKKKFASYDTSIDFITKSLAGKEVKTKKYYAKFKAKDIRGILETYNPPSVVPDYAQKVMREMERIKSM